MFSWPGLRRAWPAAAFAAIAVPFGLRFALLRRHAFDPDEFQHLHAAWCVARGMLPYRDYFDHHPPWLHFFLAPFLAFFDVDTSPRAAESFIFFSRALMAVFSGLALALTYRLGRAWAGAVTGWTGTLLLSTSVMFLDKTLEIRPDVPAVVLLLASWVALLDGIRRSGEGGRARAPFAQAGVLLGTALLCTQKLLFTLPASALVLAWYLIEPPAGTGRGERWRDVFAHALGAAAPIAVMLAVFAAQGGLYAFADATLLVNLRWPVRFSAEPRLRQLLYDNGLLVLLALAGTATAIVRLVREPRAVRALVPLHALGLGVGAFVIPVPTAQYLVPLLPLAALLAGSVVAAGLAGADRLRDGRVRVAAVAAIVATVAGFSVRPLRTIAGILHPGNTKVEDHLDRLGYLLTHAGRNETVLDGFSGLGVFRPHAYRYYFLHDEVRVLLAGRPMNQLLAALRDGTIAPEWVIADRDVLGLPDGIVAFLRANYAPVRDPIWRRRDAGLAAGDWIELGDGPRDVLAGRGWLAPERDGERTFRRASARRSTIRLPVRDAGGCRTLVLRARTVGPDAAASAAVAVNGVRAGVVPLSPAWADHPLPLDGARLRGGVNTVELTYDPPEKGTSVAVGGLGLDCLAR